MPDTTPSHLLMLQFLPASAPGYVVSAVFGGSLLFKYTHGNKEFIGVPDERVRQQLSVCVWLLSIRLPLSPV